MLIAHICQRAVPYIVSKITRTTAWKDLLEIIVKVLRRLEFSFLRGICFGRQFRKFRTQSHSNLNFSNIADTLTSEIGETLEVLLSM